MTTPPSPSALKIKIFADGADLAGIREMAANPLIKGFTTNPTLMRKAGVGDYKAFALAALKIVPDRPISFEVFADDFAGMERQAMEIASWGKYVNVKIPVTNTRGESSGPLVAKLSRQGVVVNVTALFTLDQVAEIVEALDAATPGDPVGVRRPRRRQRPRPGAAHAKRRPHRQRAAAGRGAVGEPARALEHPPGRRGGMSHHHRHQRYPEETRPRRQGPGNVLA
ncbi:MAG TPA: transaldolase family protein, partial [Rhodospirillales bacterium]